MTYELEFKPKALKDLKSLPMAEVKKIIAKLELMRNNLMGDVKKLTNFSPEYRLRVGNYRALFEVENETIVVYRVLHRKEAYD